MALPHGLNFVLEGKAHGTQRTLTLQCHVITENTAQKLSCGMQPEQLDTVLRDGFQAHGCTRQISEPYSGLSHFVGIIGDWLNLRLLSLPEGQRAVLNFLAL